MTPSGQSGFRQRERERKQQDERRRREERRQAKRGALPYDAQLPSIYKRKGAR